MGQFTADDNARVKQYAADYSAHDLAVMLVEIEKSRAVDKAIIRGKFTRKQVEEAISLARETDGTDRDPYRPAHDADWIIREILK